MGRSIFDADCEMAETTETSVVQYKNKYYLDYNQIGIRGIKLLVKADLPLLE